MQIVATQSLIESLSAGKWTAVALIGFEWAVFVVLAVRIAMLRRPVPVSLAWLLLVFSLPIVGAVFYLVFVENPLGRKRSKANRLIAERLRPMLVERWRSRAIIVEPSESDARFTGGFEHVAHFCTRVGGLPPLAGNRLELLSDSEELLRRLAADIDSAKDHCHLLYYIWMCGGKAEMVAQALINAARRGVECRVLLDDAGSTQFFGMAVCSQMREAGVKLVRALRVNPLRARLYRIDLRNHRKIAVIDGVIAYAGSQNLTDITFHYKRRKHIGPWLDSSVRVEGPAVQALALTFVSDWTHEDESQVRLEGTALERQALRDRYFPVGADASKGSSVVQVVPTGPAVGDDAAAMREALLTTIYAAGHEIIISTPYFVPDEATESALTSAARRGVNVTLIVPRITDSRLVAAASRSHYEKLLEAGIRIARFRKGVLHAKTLTADGRLSMIGSANIDMRSFLLNFEVTLFVYDEDFALKLRLLQQGYVAGSDMLDLAGWRRRPWRHRLVESFARLLGPLL